MKKIASMFALSFKSILRNRMRSMLTSLGIIIGVAAVIIMVAVGEGSQAQIEESINSLGSNMLIVTAGSNNRTGVSGGAGVYNKLTFDDVEKLSQDGLYFNIVSPIVNSRDQIVGGTGNWRALVYGVSPDFFELRNWDVEYGEIFTQRDLKLNSKVVLLGKTVADNLFPNEDPTGKTIRIKNIPVIIIGVLKAKGQTGLGGDQDDMVVMPATTVYYRLRGVGRGRIDMIQIGANSSKDIKLAVKEITEIMRESHRITGGESNNDFAVKEMSEITEMATSSSRTMTMLLAAIAGVSLVVGGIGIMNIMLVSVTERTREIGIRISVGARASDIMLQFILEAVTLSIIGGVFGVITAMVVLYGMEEFFLIAVKLNTFVIFASVGFSGAVGIFFGLYPASRAAKLNPIEALRTE